MCGVAGAIRLTDSVDFDKICIAVNAMTNQLINRGPDAFGLWQEKEHGICFAHRRLSILDLDKRSNQPMVSTDGGLIITYNGEIYNYRELRSELQDSGFKFNTSGDTEVILNLFKKYGTDAFSKLRGMFALGIFDTRNNKLVLARDPYGIKPLYYAQNNSCFLFASQVKSILAANIISREPDNLGQSGFWLTGCVPEPYTWFKNIKCLPAGSWAEISNSDNELRIAKFNDIAEFWEEHISNDISYEEIKNLFSQSINKSIDYHLVSDVPIGVFLSGGLDSGAIAGLVSERGKKNIHGVTVSFSEFSGKHQDEVPLAKLTANLYGIQHHVRTVDFNEFEKDIPSIIAAMDQPSIDGINTWFASKAMREIGVKVAISGVGGDELLYGYNSFHEIPFLVSIWNKISLIPFSKFIAKNIFLLQSKVTNNPRWKILPIYAQDIHSAYWLRRGLFTPDDLPTLVPSEYRRDYDVHELPKKIMSCAVNTLSCDMQAAVGQLESCFYLRNQLLRDTDWASMAHSIEVRTPLVDAFLLKEIQPIIKYFSKLKAKELLSEILQTPLPQQILFREKTGFNVPMGNWLKKISSSNTPRKYNTSLQNNNVSRDWAKIITDSIY